MVRCGAEGRELNMRTRWDVTGAVLLGAGWVLAACEEQSGGTSLGASSSGTVGEGGGGGESSTGGHTNTGTGTEDEPGGVTESPILPDTHVDGGGTCAPEKTALNDLVACCNDVPCRGWCYEENAGLACSCGEPPYGVAGGCPEGTICCQMGCRAPGNCGYANH